MRSQKKISKIFIVPTYSGLVLGLGAFGLFYSFLYGHGPRYSFNCFITFSAIGFMSNNNIRDIKLEDFKIDPMEANKASLSMIKLKNLSSESRIDQS